MQTLAETMAALGITVTDETVENVRHPVAFNAGPRIYRVLRATVNGRKYVQRQWHNNDGSLHHIDGGFEA